MEQSKTPLKMLAFACAEILLEIPQRNPIKFPLIPMSQAENTMALKN